ncbi:hypothetical protein KAH55_08675 [bacterium]|nr:hypothetical protein [bacterium]
MKRWLTIILFLLCFQVGRAQFNLYLEQQIPAQTGTISSMEISPNGRFLAFGDANGTITIWDIPAKRQIHRLRGHRGDVSALLFDHQNQRLISGGHDGRVRVWDLYSGTKENEIKDFSSPILSLAISPDDRFLAAAGKKKTVYLWEFPLGKLKGKLKGHKKSVLAAAFSVGGDQLLSVAEDKQMIVWDVNKLTPIRKTTIESRTIARSGIDIKSAAFSADRKFVGVGLEEHILAKGGRGMIFKYNLAFFDWQTGAEIETLVGNRENIHFFAITPDKRYAITSNSTLQKKRISFWNIQNGIVEQHYPVEGPASAMAVSNDGRWLAVGYQNGKGTRTSTVNVWQLSGIDGFQRFSNTPALRSEENRGFGSNIKLTTPSAPLIQYGERKRMAVIHFDSPGLEEAVARTATYLLESKLGNSPLVELVERNQIKKVLDELAYQQTGLTANNAIQVGQQLNAEYILIGSINKLGNLVIITVKLVNVETARIEGSREVQCANATIETISDMITILAPTLVKM